MYVCLLNPLFFLTVVVISRRRFKKKNVDVFCQSRCFRRFFVSCQASNHEVRIHGYYDVWIDRFLYHDLLISQVVLRF